MGNSQVKPTQLSAKEAAYIRDIFLLARRVQKVPYINRYTLTFIRAVEDIALAIQRGEERSEIRLYARIAEKHYAAWQKATFGGAAFIQYEYHWLRSADATFVA
jgi:hypothetical protein